MEPWQRLNQPSASLRDVIDGCSENGSGFSWCSALPLMPDSLSAESGEALPHLGKQSGPFRPS